MKAKLTAAFIVLALCIALCTFALKTVERVTAELRTLADQALSAEMHSDLDRALLLIEQAQARLDNERFLLEVLTLHESINEAAANLSEARLAVKQNNSERFESSLIVFMEQLTILYEQQRPSLSNLL